MDEKTLRKKVVEYLNTNANAGPEGIGSDDKDLIDAGIIDSFGLLGLIGFLEDEFKLRIDASDIDPANFNTVNKIVAVVSKR